MEQGLFHGGVAQREPLLQEVDAQHALQLERRATDTAGLAFGAAVGFEQGNKHFPVHHALHFVEKLALARALGTQIKTQIGLLHRGGSAAISLLTSKNQPDFGWTRLADVP